MVKRVEDRVDATQVSLMQMAGQMPPRTMDVERLRMQVDQLTQQAELANQRVQEGLYLYQRANYMAPYSGPLPVQVAVPKSSLEKCQEGQWALDYIHKYECLAGRWARVNVEVLWDAARRGRRSGRRRSGGGLQ